MSYREEQDRLTKAFPTEVLLFHQRLTGIESSEAEMRRDGLVKFLIACRRCGPQVASESVDELWHDFLLFTAEYREYCSEYLGGFVEHRPINGEGPSGYLDSRARLEGIFGSLDDGVWPQIDRQMWSVGTYRECSTMNVTKCG